MVLLLRILGVLVLLGGLLAALLAIGQAARLPGGNATPAILAAAVVPLLWGLGGAVLAWWAAAVLAALRGIQAALRGGETALKPTSGRREPRL